MIAESLTLESLGPPLVLSCLAVSGLVLSDYHRKRAGRYLFKPLAAAAFLWVALLPGLPVSPYASWLLAGLVCCALGDLLLMPDSEHFFLGGLAAFLCGHLLFATAFLQLPVNMGGLAASALPALALLFIAMRWFSPHLERKMKVPVALYTLVITAMLLCAGLSYGHRAAPFIITGAWGFAISDLAVARRQFVVDSPYNGLWGTPLYFFSQILLACTTSLA